MEAAMPGASFSDDEWMKAAMACASVSDDEYVRAKTPVGAKTPLMNEEQALYDIQTVLDAVEDALKRSDSMAAGMQDLSDDTGPPRGGPSEEEGGVSGDAPAAGEEGRGGIAAPCPAAEPGASHRDAYFPDVDGHADASQPASASAGGDVFFADDADQAPGAGSADRDAAPSAEQRPSSTLQQVVFSRQRLRRLIGLLQERTPAADGVLHGAAVRAQALAAGAVGTPVRQTREFARRASAQAALRAQALRQARQRVVEVAAGAVGTPVRQTREFARRASAQAGDLAQKHREHTVRLTRRVFTGREDTRVCERERVRARAHTHRVRACLLCICACVR